MTEFSEQVEEYILKDRYWRRELRIGYTKRQLAQAKSEISKNFWRAVLQRIDHDEQDRFWRNKP